jgi:hypothetical protein
MWYRLTCFGSAAGAAEAAKGLRIDSCDRSESTDTFDKIINQLVLCMPI